MNYLNINVPANHQITVVGDIHEHDYQFEKLLDQVQPSEKMLLVSVGDIYHKGFGRHVAEKITLKFKSLKEQGFGFAVRGNHELKEIKKAKQQKQMTESLEWFNQQPLALSFLFQNSKRLTIVHGGVSPKHTLENIDNDVEVCYTRDLDENDVMIQLKWIVTTEGRKLVPARPNGVTWHEKYDGRLGYIISGHEPQKDGKPKYYNHSANLDTACYATGVLSAQVYDENGLQDLIQISGPNGDSGSL